MCAFHNIDDAIEYVLRAQVKLIEAEWPEGLMVSIPWKN